MTKPEGIPETFTIDVWDAASLALRSHVPAFGFGTATRIAVIEIIARAIMAERKRAADVAESWAGTERRLAIRTEYNDEATSHILCADLAIDIAEHIRSPRPPHNPKDAQ